MKKITLLALFLLGIATYVGLSMLLQKAFPEHLEQGPIIIVAVLVVAVSAALFVFGVFLGFLYGGSSRHRKMDIDTHNRFRGALEFERRERVRLERTLYEAKQVMINLEDRLTHQKTEMQDKAASLDTDKMKTEIEELTTRHDRVHQDLVRRKERVADLMAELSVAQTEAQEARDEAEQLKATIGTPHPAGKVIPPIESSSLKGVLEGLVALDGVSLALVADDYGLVVEAVGDGMPPETLAAMSSLVANLRPQVRDILPIGEVATISLGDDHGLVLDTRYFDLFGVRCALAVARDEDHPYPGLAQHAIDEIRVHLND